MLFPGAFSLYSGAFFRAFFRACCPLFFLYMFPLGGGPVFCRAFFGGFWVLFPCFFPCFFSCFFSVLFLCLLSCFFSCIFPFFLVLIFVFFFRALGGTQDKQPQYFAFWPVHFLVLFLVVTTSEDRIYTTYQHESTDYCPNMHPFFFRNKCSVPVVFKLIFVASVTFVISPTDGHLSTLSQNWRPCRCITRPMVIVITIFYSCIC